MTIKEAGLVEAFENKGWVETDFLGDAHVMLRSDAPGSLAACMVTVRHSYPFIGNSTRNEIATRVASMLGASEPVEFRSRGWPQDLHAAAAEGLPEADQPQPAPHDDDRAVDAFARAMKEKLATARTKGRSGWDGDEPGMQQRLSDMLRDHVEKGDPRDVANFAMFLHQRGESILPAQQPAPGGIASWRKHRAKRG